MQLDMTKLGLAPASAGSKPAVSVVIPKAGAGSGQAAPVPAAAPVRAAQDLTPGARENSPRSLLKTRATAFGEEFDHNNIGRVEKLGKGAEGVAFKLVDANGNVRVFKFQKDDPASTLAAASIMARAGVAAPKVASTRRKHVRKLHEAIKDHKGEAAEEFRRYARGQGDDRGTRFPHVVEQDFVGGKDLMALAARPDDLVAALAARKFQGSAGRIFAADVFSGNVDRLNPSAPGQGAFVHANNLKAEQMGAGSPLRARPIDNAFTPGIRGGPWAMGLVGKENARSSFQSVGAANDDLLAQSGATLFDELLENAEGVDTKEGRFGTSAQEVGDALISHHLRSQHDPTKSSEQEIEAKVGARLSALKAKQADYAEARQAAHAHLRGAFVRNFTAGGARARTRLLERGQGWKRELGRYGVGNEALEQFRHRKRFQRLLGLKNVNGEYAVAGAEAKDAALARGPDATRRYRQLILQHEKKMPEEQAKALAVDEDAYKGYMRSELSHARRRKYLKQLGIGSQERRELAAKDPQEFRTKMTELLKAKRENAAAAAAAKPSVVPSSSSSSQ